MDPDASIKAGAAGADSVQPLALAMILGRADARLAGSRQMGAEVCSGTGRCPMKRFTIMTGVLGGLALAIASATACIKPPQHPGTPPDQL